MKSPDTGKGSTGDTAHGDQMTLSICTESLLVDEDRRATQHTQQWKNVKHAEMTGGKAKLHSKIRVWLANLRPEPIPRQSLLHAVHGQGS